MNAKTTTTSLPVTIWDHLELILRWRRFLVIILTLIAIAAVSYSLLAKKWYSSTSRMLPPPSLTASLFGLLPNLDMGILGGSDLSTEQRMVMSIFTSRRLQDRVIKQFNWMEEHGFRYRRDAYKRFIKTVDWQVDEHGTIIVNVEETSADLAAKTCNYIINEVRKEYNTITVAQAKNQREFVEKRLNENREELQAAERKLQQFQAETGVVALEEQLRVSVESLASLQSALALAEVELDVSRNTLPESSSIIVAAKARVDALRKQVNSLGARQDNQAEEVFISLDVAPEIGMKYYRLFREVEIQNTILETLMPLREQARIGEARDASELYVVDWGAVPDRRIRPKRAFLVIGIMFISFVVLYLYILLVEWMRQLKQADPDRYAQVEQVLRGFQPARFFRFSQTSSRDGSDGNGP